MANVNWRLSIDLALKAWGEIWLFSAMSLLRCIENIFPMKKIFETGRSGIFCICCMQTVLWLSFVDHRVCISVVLSCCYWLLCKEDVKYYPSFFKDIVWVFLL